MGKLFTTWSSIPDFKSQMCESKLHNEPSVQAISKKAVVKKLQRHYARPEGVPLMETGPEFKIEVSILKDVATVMIDTTGSSLFKRGYRTEKVELLSRKTWQQLFATL